MSSTRFLEQLTEEQEARLSAIRDRWIAVGLSTAPADRPRAEAAARLAYRRAGLSDAVRIIWAGSPMAGAAIAMRLIQRASGLRYAADIMNAPIAAVTRRAADLIATEVSTQITNDVAHPVAAPVVAQAWEPVNHEVARRITHPMTMPGYAQHDAPRLAFFDTLGQCGMDVSELDALMELAESCGWWWPFNDVCVLSERASHLAHDERGLLHAPDGPAIAYPDGWTVFAWHGVRVPAATILARSGFDRHVTDSGARSMRTTQARCTAATWAATSR